MSGKRKYSSIWTHFTEEKDQRANCKYCKTSLSISSGSQSNLHRHLKSKHPLVPITIERQEPTPTQVDLENDEPGTSSSRTQQPHQQSITQFLSRPPPIRKVEKIDKLVLKMVAKGHHALRIVEEPDFKNLIEAVSHCQGYTLPSRKSLSKSLLPSTYNEILERVKKEVSSAFAVCLTTDGWTSRGNESFMAVTAHFIDDNTTLKSYLLSCDEYGERHTGENLSNFLRKVISDFDISNKITAILSDNAANMTSAINLGGWRAIGCFAHSLNLAVQSSLKNINDVVVKVKRIVEYFHKSTQAYKKLREAEKQMNLPEVKLKQDVPTRWNSTFEMLKRIYDVKDAVISTLSLNRPELCIELQEWDIIKEVLPILQPFYEITLEISAEKNVTLSKVTVFCNLLEHFISNCKSGNPKIEELIKTMQKEITSRFGNFERNNLYAESTILDPRFKRKGFKNDKAFEDTVRTMRNRICNIRLPQDNEVLAETTCVATTTTDTMSIWKDYDLDFSRTVRPDNVKAASIREFDKYLNEEYLNRKKDPLEWWKERKNIYPHVYVYAMKRLCIVATSVPCERIFSATGQILNERRTLLKANKVSELVFLYHNM